MTRVLIDGLLTLLQMNPDGPGFRPGRRIGERHFIVDPVGGRTSEPFDQVQVLAGSHHVALGRKIGRLDDQRIAFPAASRVTAPLPNALGQMRTAVERNDACLVDRLVH